MDFVAQNSLESILQKNFRENSLPQILELGCGTGISGIAAALCGNHVVISDRDVCRERAEKCIQLNEAAIREAGGSCEMEEL